MKKIVALVLSLVMVLGLATVAMADTTATTLKYADGYKLYDITGTTDLNTLKSDITKTVTGNVTTTVGDKTTVQYTVTTYAVDGNTLSEVGDASVAQYKLVKDGVVVAYLVMGDLGSTKAVVAKTVKSVKAAVATCGDYANDKEYNVYVIDDKAYYADGSAVNGYAVLNGKFVPVGAAATAEVHKLAENTYAAATGKADTLKCSVCKNVYTVLSTEAVKTMAPAAYAKDATTGLYYATGAVTAPEAGDKVESAETFDAGIAMYVGMSVMAAAGSAVVLKKKD